MGSWTDVVSGVARSAEHAVAAKVEQLRNDPVKTIKDAAVGTYDLVIGDDIHTLRDKNASFGEKALAVVSIASNFVGPEGKLLTKGVELGVKALAEHVGERVIERAVGSLEKTVGHEVASAVTHAAERAAPHLVEAATKAGEALEKTIKVVNTTHNVVVAATGLPDHARRAFHDLQSLRDSHLSAAERVKAAEHFATDTTHAVMDAVVIAKGANEGFHGAQTVGTHVETAAEKAQQLATSVERHAATAMTSAVGRVSAATENATKHVATAAEVAVRHAETAVHNVTKYVAHAANDTVKATEHAVRETSRRVASKVEGAALAAHLPAAASAVRGVEHQVDRATKHLAEAATTAIEHGKHVAGGEIAHAATTAGAAIHKAEHAMIDAAKDAAHSVRTSARHVGEEHAPAAPKPPHEPHTALEKVAATARHVGTDLKETYAKLADPIIAKVDDMKEQAASIKKHALDAADALASGHATPIAKGIGQISEALHERKENAEARESVAAALEKISPEARERAEKSGFAQVGIPHIQAKPYEGHGQQTGTVTSVIGDRVEQYAGRNSWTTYDKDDLKALNKALKENAELHSENKPTHIREGDRLEVSQGRITLTPADPSKLSVSVTVDHSGQGLAAQPSYTPQQTQPQHATGRA